MPEHGGWIPLWRKVWDSKISPKHKRCPYTEFEAWLDLLCRAVQNPDGNILKRDGEMPLRLQPGEILCSLRGLQMTWKWGSPNKVRRFIDALCNLEMIEISAQNPTRLRVVNAERYGLVWNTERNKHGTATEQRRNSDGTIQQEEQVKQVKQKNINARVLKADLFIEFREKYPNRQPPHNWTTAGKAWTARLRQGVDPADILRGAENYAAWVRARGDEGTEFVKMASTFLGPSKHWEQFQEAVKTDSAKKNAAPRTNYTTEEYDDLPDWARKK